MKKRLFTLCLALMATTVSTLAKTLFINEWYVPDEKFREFLLSTTYGRDEEVTDEELSGVTKIDVSGLGIKSLEGISSFTALKELYCANNSLTKLSLKNNTALTTLVCNDNQLTELDLSANTNMKKVACYNNQIQPEMMKAFVEGLNKKSGAVLVVCGNDPSAYGESDNMIFDSQVSTAKRFSWTVYRKTDSGADPFNASGLEVYSGIKTVLDNNLYYFLDEASQTATLLPAVFCTKWSGVDYSEMTSVEIPRTITSDHVAYTVTAIYEKAFYKCDKLVKAKFHKGLKVIGQQAFACSGVTNIDLPTGLESVDLLAFAETPLRTIELPATIKDLSGFLFFKCEDLTAIYSHSFDPANVHPLAFFKTLALDGGSEFTPATLYVPKGCVEKYNESAGWNGFSTLGQIQENNSYEHRTKIEVNGILYALDKTTSSENIAYVIQSDYVGLTNVNIPATITPGSEPYRVYGILEGAFSNCWTLERVVMHVGLTSISKNAFYRCVRLASVNIPEGVTFIGENAFQDAALTELSLPSTIRDLRNFFVYGCTNLETIYAYMNPESVDKLPGSKTQKNLFTVTNGSLTEATVYVPAGSLYKYQMHVSWSDLNLQEMADDDDMAVAVFINEENFPDENFRNYLLSLSDGSDGKLTNKELKNFTLMSLRDMNIQDLTGIGFFTSLSSLDCMNNSLTTLDVSMLPSLRNLSCSNNMLTSLTVCNNGRLQWIECANNQIGIAAMGELVCSLPDKEEGKGDDDEFLPERIEEKGELHVVTTVGNCSNIITPDQVAMAKQKGWRVMIYKNMQDEGFADYMWYDYDGTDVLEINATNFPDETFRGIVGGTDINTDGDEYLTPEELTAVKELDVAGQVIMKLTGIEYFKALKTLKCEGNALSSLDVSQNTELTYLDCSMNGLTKLDVSQNKKLTYLNCFHNLLTTLNVSTNEALTKLLCHVNKISGDGMEGLVNSLPKVKGGILYVNDDNFSPDNVITKAQVEKATNKGWKVQKYNASGNALDYGGQGDVDGNGSVDDDDLDLIEKIIMGQASGVSVLAGDMNNDGKTDAADIVVMINILNSLKK